MKITPTMAQSLMQVHAANKAKQHPEDVARLVQDARESIEAAAIFGNDDCTVDTVLWERPVLEEAAAILRLDGFTCRVEGELFSKLHVSWPPVQEAKIEPPSLWKRIGEWISRTFSTR